MCDIFEKSSNWEISRRLSILYIIVYLQKIKMNTLAPHVPEEKHCQIVTIVISQIN